MNKRYPVAEEETATGLFLEDVLKEILFARNAKRKYTEAI